MSAVYHDKYWCNGSRPCGHKGVACGCNGLLQRRPRKSLSTYLCNRASDQGLRESGNHKGIGQNMWGSAEPHRAMCGRPWASKAFPYHWKPWSYHGGTCPRCFLRVRRRRALSRTNPSASAWLYTWSDSKVAMSSLYKLFGDRLPSITTFPL